MFRLAHISDVHLGPLPDVTYRDLASKRMVGYVNWQRNRRRFLHDGVHRRDRRPTSRRTLPTISR